MLLRRSKPLSSLAASFYYKSILFNAFCGDILSLGDTGEDSLL